MITKIEVDPDGRFGKRIREAFERVDDLSIPFELIRESWFKGNRAIFALGGPGKFADLNAEYKRRKQKEVGFVYPILMRTGKLKQALTVKGSTDSIASMMDNKKTLALGVNPRNKIFGYLHYGTKHMPARPYVLLGAEQVAPNELNNRTAAWRKLLVDYVLQVTRKKG